jgi:tryptophan synthase beta chain
VSTSPAEPDISPVPDLAGHFGDYGGLFAPESLMAAIEQLAKEYEAARTDPGFTAELDDLLKNYAARPTRLSQAKRFGAEFAGGRHSS